MFGTFAFDAIRDQVSRLGLVLNTFDDLVDHGRTLVSSPVVVADEFEDSAGLDAASSTGETYNAAGYASNPPVDIAVWSRAVSSNDSGQGGYSYRVVLAAADISTSGNGIALTFEASSASGLDVDNVSIVERSGATADGVTVPTEVLFSGASGFSIGAGQSIESDVLAFSVDETKDYLVVIDVSATNGNPRYVDAGEVYAASGTDSYNIASGAAFGGSITRTFAVTAMNVVEDAPALDVRSVGTAVGSAPASAFVVAKFSESDPDAVYASSDGGVTWDAVTLTDYGDYGSGQSVFGGPVSFTGGGTDVRLRATKAGGTECRLHGWGIVVG